MGRNQQTESGASIVEAVLVTPLFLLLILGIIELGPLFMNWNAIHGASREGARVASVTGSGEDADFEVLADIQRRLKTSIADLNYVIVFKATSTTDDPPPACSASAKVGNRGVPNLCNVYYRADFSLPPAAFGTGLPTAVDTKWTSIDRVDWSSGPVDLVGVHLSTDHRTLTGIVRSKTLRYTTVFAIEATTGEGD